MIMIDEISHNAAAYSATTIAVSWNVLFYCSLTPLTKMHGKLEEKLAEILFRKPILFSNYSSNLLRNF
jgi:hypothetical protein